MKNLNFHSNNYEPITHHLKKVYPFLILVILVFASCERFEDDILPTTRIEKAGQPSSENCLNCQCILADSYSCQFCESNSNFQIGALPLSKEAYYEKYFPEYLVPGDCTFGGFQDDELFIQTGHNYEFLECNKSIPQELSIEYIPGFPYYKYLGTTTNKVKKLSTKTECLEQPLYDGYPNGEGGTKMGLCFGQGQDNCVPQYNILDFPEKPYIEQYRFKAGGEPTTEAPYEIMLGGLFKIGINNPNMPSVYLSMQYPTGLWYTGGPDIKVFYDLVHETSNSCDTEAMPMAYVAASEYANNEVSPDLAYIANTSYEQISEYWLENAVTIGVKGGSFAKQNQIKNFKIGATQLRRTTQDLCLGAPTGLIKVGELNTLYDPNGFHTFEVGGSINIPEEYHEISGKTEIKAGDRLAIKVSAEFEEVNEKICRWKIFNLDNSTPTYNSIKANFRGYIEGFKCEVYLICENAGFQVTSNPKLKCYSFDTETQNPKEK